MAESKPGFGDLLRRGSQPTIQSPPPSPPILQPQQPQVVQPSGQNCMPADPLVARYWLYAQLLRVGDAHDKQFVVSAVRLDELAQVLRKVLPNSPWAIALSFVVDHQDSARRLLKELLQNERLPDWLTALVGIITGASEGD